ncbi:MAG TPA: DUF58 domain-containing protein, partial [Dehalococcoidales bacterium]|nr:DUF58 domain-containing protein [Dehalococcoidales bacterium]
MPRVSLILLCQIYVPLALLAAAVVAPWPYWPLALGLLLAVLSAALRRPPPRFNIVVDTAALCLAPLPLAALLERLTALTALATQITAVALTLPVIYLIDINLRENNRAPVPMKEKEGRRTTPAFAALLGAAASVMLIALAAGRPVLLLAGAALALYLLALMIFFYAAVPRRPFTADEARKRVLAGATETVPLHVDSRAAVSLRARLAAADSWVQVSPSEIVLKGGRNRLHVSLTPPLAGGTRPRITVSATDPRGLVRVTQALEPLRLHVIPRAEYAAWLARKYLKQTDSGVVTAAKLPPPANVPPERGSEYRDSRAYQPGDRLKDIDWKHTLKLSQLIVREFQEVGDQAVIIAVNLAAPDAEAADKLAFNLITAALTLARENIPTALAAYNHERAVMSTAVLEPLEMLRRALSLVGEIRAVNLEGRYLEPADIARIRRNYERLKRSESEPARRLLNIIDFQRRSIEEAARGHPATLALTAVTRQVPAPA